MFNILQYRNHVSANTAVIISASLYKSVMALGMPSSSVTLSVCPESTLWQND